MFLRTADNEKEHAKMWFKEMNGIGDTAQNLKNAAEGENYEWTDMYDGFAKTADCLLYTSCKQGVMGSNPIISTTSAMVDGDGKRW